jgi:iron complex outermembrane recepter protein
MRIGEPFAVAKFSSALLASVLAQLAGADDISALHTTLSGPALDEITVTAQKRAQSMQHVPISLSAFTAAALDRAGVGDMADLSRLVPTLETQTDDYPTTTTFRLRRVGNIGNIPTFEPSVGVFIDGAYRSRSVFGASDLFDLERVEVLNGPQSTLYGKNVTAGVVGIYSAEPSETFTARGEISGGVIDSAKNASLVHLKTGVSGPLTNTLRASIGGSWSYNQNTTTQALIDGSGENAFNLNRYAVRGQLQWSPGNAFDARLIVGTVQEHDNGQISDLYYDPTGFVPKILRTWQAAGISIPCTDNNPLNRISCSRLKDPEDFQSEEATLIATYATPDRLKLTSLTSWDHFRGYVAEDDVAQLSAAVLRFHDTQETSSFQEELRLSSPGGETIDWLAGIFYYQSDFNRGDNGRTPTFLYDTYSANAAVTAVNQALLGVPIPIAQPGQLGYTNNSQDTDYVGVFGQSTWKITPRLFVSGGLRWQEEKKYATIGSALNDPSPSVISLLLANPSIAGSLSRSAEKITWSFTPQYYWSDHSMLYATAATGFKSGGFNVGFGTIPINSREFLNETVMQYESGVKTTILNGRLQADASAFHTEYRNYQNAAFIGAQFTVGNAEKVALNGFESNIAALIGGGFTANLATSYAVLEYVENYNGQCYPGRTPDSPTDPTACNLSGTRPNNAPAWRTSLGAQYEHPTRWGALYARADWSWTGAYNTSFSSDPRLVQPPYSWVNLRTGIRHNNFETVLWMDNVLNETVADLQPVLNLYAGDGSYQSYLEQGRSFGVTFRAFY